MKKIAILGSSGFLAMNIDHYLKRKFNCIKIGRKNCDIKINYFNQKDLDKVFYKNKFDCILNAVGYTNIENIEKNKLKCYNLNVLVVKNIVNAIKKSKHKTHLLHFSSDHIYCNKGYSKENNINIVNYYAFSKLISELCASEVSSTILRTNFFGHSLNKNKISLSDWIISSLKTKKKIGVFNDIFFNPLNFETLSNILEVIINNKKNGVFNVGSSNGISKASFAKKIAEHLGLNKNYIKEINSKNFFKIKRPLDMRMNCKKFEETFNYKLPDLNQEILKL